MTDEAASPLRRRMIEEPCGLLRVACLRVEVPVFQLAHDRFGEAAERPLLEFVGDSAHQEITGQPHGRWCPMQPPPLAVQFEEPNRHAVRLGLRTVRGLANTDGAAIVAARAGAPFATVVDLWRRSNARSSPGGEE